ncbi:hypothetical protein CEXT_790581 [Caerostris extrusa]|uniref:Uncharacterized protein n=1 Tax=Caerostris extrusa TaxID=172846 RepID=A0AAV4XGB4_CAEEX|nr:hypothetical protein CEXT_790581 [Caerostris extrusa]
MPSVPPTIASAIETFAMKSSSESSRVSWMNILRFSELFMDGSNLVTDLKGSSSFEVDVYRIFRFTTCLRISPNHFAWICPPPPHPMAPDDILRSGKPQQQCN